MMCPFQPHCYNVIADHALADVADRRDVEQDASPDLIRLRLHPAAGAAASGAAAAAEDMECHDAASVAASMQVIIKRLNTM